MKSDVSDLTARMEKRGGGVKKIELVDKRSELSDFFQLHCTFETADAMGANFINSCLEQFAQTLEKEVKNDKAVSEENLEVIMSILSNYVPGCIVRAEVSCKIEELDEHDDISPIQFAEKMVQAVAIAKAEPFRAVTHNKGIMNGIDSVVLATGNDFRAVEAGIHAYAAKDGRYTSLTHATIENDIFKFWIEIPLALGTVGGLTGLHPMVRLSLDILQNPSARQLMEIAAVAGLAQNFAALRSLVTTGIQQGHMKMHLLNILNQLQASTPEKTAIVQLFRDQQVTHRAVAEALEKLRTA